VAVSGGVDSVALLHWLNTRGGLELTVAHFDHGIRTDSEEDRLLVQAMAKDYNLPFVYKEANLGPEVSEATARDARYEFLRLVAKDNNAQAILTAHHLDDVLETAVINLLRGTGRKGLTSLDNRKDILRPLLNVEKNQIYEYAKTNNLHWREDSTNQNTDYLRNYVRLNILPKLDEQSRREFIDIINTARATNVELDVLLLDDINEQSNDNKLNRQYFTSLPHNVAREIMAAWLRQHGVKDFNAKTIERLVVAGKTASPGSSHDVVNGVTLKLSNDHLALDRPER